MTSYLKAYFLLLFIALIEGDPCTEYQTIDSWERSAANGIGTRCDSLLPKGWYRIISGAGELMPTKCIHGGARCGTGFPVWLNGSYPEDGETVNVKACASNTDGDCCYKSYDIQIKNCSSFYVYNLVPVHGCPQSYCFGAELPCPEGLVSYTGFTPGCHFDPCMGGYTTIDSWERSAANGIGTRCDALLQGGWYRIISGAGELMPTECIPGGARCGTGFPVWLNGKLPDNGETVNVTACASNTDGDCCYKSYDIQIKNCASFYVYNLVPVDGCPQAYCFGFELPCPVGQISETNFTPGCYSDPCQNYDTLSGEIKRSSGYTMGDEAAIDDSTLTSGWYRFDSYVGNDIVKTSQEMFKCGTKYPVWMNGEIPSVLRTTVNRTCCITGVNDSCESAVDIQIRNCGSFRVYNLQKLRQSQTAYCFGTLSVTTTTATTTSTEEMRVEKSISVSDNTPWIVAGVLAGVVLIPVIVITVLITKYIRKNTRHSPTVSCTSLPRSPPPYDHVIENKRNEEMKSQEVSKFAHQANGQAPVVTVSDRYDIKKKI